jgi:hypothetical protein
VTVVVVVNELLMDVLVVRVVVVVAFRLAVTVVVVCWGFVSRCPSTIARYTYCGDCTTAKETRASC